MNTRSTHANALGIGIITALVALGAMLLGGATASAEPQVGALVGNVDQSGHEYTSNAFQHDIAQGFRTGNDPAGYTLSSVDLSFWQWGTSQPAYSVSIYEDTGQNRPGEKLATLRNPDMALPDRGNARLTPHTVLRRFKANRPITLESGTFYWVVLDVVNSASAGIIVTTSDSQDSGGAEGWSIENNSRRRSNTHRASVGSGWVSYTRVFFMQLNGYANAPSADDAGTDPHFTSGYTTIVHGGTVTNLPRCTPEQEAWRDSAPAGVIRIVFCRS